MHSVRSNSDIWAVTTFYNPLKLCSRIANYHLFRERLSVPLLTIELSYTEDFELGKEDAEILVHLNGRSILWQKERLLNKALEYVPKQCDAIAWLDSDIILGQADWVQLLRRQLSQVQFVQLFNEVCDLPRSCLPEDSEVVDLLPVASSTASWVVEGKEVIEALRHPEHRSVRSSANGLAWAARRELLKAHGFYDACVLGSGDRAMICAALGEFDGLLKALCMNDSQAEHYLAWAKPFYDTLGGEIGCLDGRIYHLWHGNPERRRLGTRYQILQPHDFDPQLDLTISEAGCWEWDSDKEEMHQAVYDYFESRQEDA